jgi:hypothetical protein
MRKRHISSSAVLHEEHSPAIDDWYAVYKCTFYGGLYLQYVQLQSIIGASPVLEMSSRVPEMARSDARILRHDLP